MAVRTKQRRIGHRSVQSARQVAGCRINRQKPVWVEVYLGLQHVAPTVIHLPV
jgi:hypothetical protein